MKTTSFFLVLILASCATSYKPIITKSTQQKWSGGIAGKKGINYYIEFESEKNIQLDSLYFQDNCFKLDSNSRNSPNSYFIINENIYKIVIQESSQERVPDFQNETIKSSDKKPCTIPSFEGKAMITFQYKNKRDTLLIESFERLPSLAYP